MHLQISLDPALDINGSDFVSAWNNNPETTQLGEAQLQSPKGGFESYDPTLGQQLVPVLLGLAGALATNALYDLLKAQVLSMLKPRNQSATLDVINITEVPQPDGSRLIVINYDIE